MREENVPGSKYLNIPAGNSSSDAHLAEGQVLLEEQTLNNAKSLI
jgi:hypothetical protein